MSTFNEVEALMLAYHCNYVADRLRPEYFEIRRPARPRLLDQLAAFIVRIGETRDQTAIAARAEPS